MSDPGPGEKKSGGFKDYLSSRVNVQEKAPEGTQLIKMGRCGIAATPCGTDGLGPCVGMVVKQNRRDYFVAHISDNNRYTPDRLNELQALTRASVRDRLRELGVQPPAGGVIFVATSNLADPSSHAIILGIQAALGPVLPFFRREVNGFFVEEDDSFHILRNGGDAFDGTQRFTVPIFHF